MEFEPRDDRPCLNNFFSLKDSWRVGPSSEQKRIANVLAHGRSLTFLRMCVVFRFSLSESNRHRWGQPGMADPQTTGGRTEEVWGSAVSLEQGASEDVELSRRNCFFFHFFPTFSVVCPCFVRFFCMVFHFFPRSLKAIKRFLTGTTLFGSIWCRLCRCNFL